MDTQHPAPPRSLLWHLLRGIILVPLVLATLIALAYAVEDWRGERAWAEVRRELIAKGEPTEMSALAPPPVPDDQNLAMAPLLRPLLAYHRGPAGDLVWEDRTEESRLESVDRENWMMRARPPRRRSWIRGERLDLAAWQAYYRKMADEIARKKLATPPAAEPVLSQRYGLPTNWGVALPATHVVRPGYPQTRTLPPDLAARYGVATTLTAAEFARAFTFPVPAAPGSPASDVLHALSLVDPELDALAVEAGRRPLGRFPVHYDEHPSWGVLLPHLSQVKKLAMVLQLRATARLAAGKVTAAHSDTLLAMRLAELMRDEPFLISQVVRAAGWTIALQPVWEGITDHRWNEPQLAAISERLRAVDLAATIDRSLHCQQLPDFVPADDEARARLAEDFRAYSSNLGNEDGFPPEQIELAGWLIRHGPRGWFYQNQLAIFTRVGKQRASYAAWYGTTAITNLTRPAELPVSRVYPYRFIADLFSRMISIRRGNVTLLRVQAQIHLSLAASALERHFLAAGTYPVSLDALVPRYLDRVPTDPMTGGPLRYSRTQDGRFRLYSVGLDGLDDGGTMVITDSSQSDETARGPVLATGDWIWPTGSR